MSNEAKVLSYDEATQQAIQLRKQGMTYPKIAEHLQSIGYKSPYSRDIVGHLAVRQMVIKADKEAAKSIKRRAEKSDVAETPKEVTAPKADILDAIKVLVEARAIDVPAKLRLIDHLLKTADKF